MHLIYNALFLLVVYIIRTTPAAYVSLLENKRILESTDYWGPWSGYSACSTTCGPGFKSRTRSCNSFVNRNPQCVGAGTELTSCHLNPCSTECVDKIDICYQYDKNVCSLYADWAKQSCERFCGLCGAVPSKPAITTTTTQAPVRIDGGWSTWSTFSSCSKTCGQGVMFRYRSCNNPVPSGSGARCSGKGQENYGCFMTACGTTPAPYTDWESWSSYGPCSVTCGTGEKVRERYRYCTDTTQCKLIGYDRADCKEKPCPVDGQWGSWDSWSKCSVSCDLGMITRHRSCDNPAPAHGGTSCSGKNTDSHDCTMGQCPVWSHWFDGDCSASCGNGTRERLRHCSTGRDIDCTGQPLVMVPCLEAHCLIHLVLLTILSRVEDTHASDNRRFLFQLADSLWGPWTSYGACSVTCGPGTKTRTRICYVRSQSSPNCVGSSTDKQICTLTACPTAAPIQTSCSDIATNCHDLDTSQKVCSKFPDWARKNCNKYCGFCRVSVVQTCADGLTTCGMYGPTVCTNYTSWARTYCSKYCGFCHDASIPTSNPSSVNGGWSAWSDLTSCSESCGNGVTRRTRTCTNPAPSSGGAFCQGNSQESYACNVRPCLNTAAVNGGWSSWSGWSTCSVTCQFGVQSRDRTCTNPAPSGGGAGCHGNHTESQMCSQGPCAAWTHWFDGTCSASCGQGQRERLRHCSTGHDNDCPGNAYEIVTCTGNNC